MEDLLGKPNNKSETYIKKYRLHSIKIYLVGIFIDRNYNISILARKLSSTPPIQAPMNTYILNDFIFIHWSLGSLK